MPNQQFPAQHQNQRPGIQTEMSPEPIIINPNYQGSGKLTGKVTLITGGDSGIGASVAWHFAREGADVSIIFLSEVNDAQNTKNLVEQEGCRCLLIQGDIGDEQFCANAIEQTIAEFGQLDILVNNAAEQHPQENLEDISAEQLEATFKTNIFSMFYLVKASLPHFAEGSRIINTTSVTAYRGSSHLLDYSATKGAIIAFTRSLSQNLAEKKILVNAVAPGPIWTPLIPSTFSEDKVSHFGSDVPLKRAGQPCEVAPAFVYLASSDSSYVTGQVVHVNGGEVING